IEVNALVETLRHQRLDALEATTLLRKVMAEIDVAVFTFDEDQELTFVNRAGARLLSQPAERLLGRRAGDLDLADYLTGEAPRVINTAFPGGVGRWEIRRSQFRQGGRPHALLVLSDLSQPLREEERQAWQRLPGSHPPTMELWVEDEGPGLSNTGNLFVPFFTTKPGGSGIGLVLSRQIAEAHGGSLVLENRDDRQGCRASLRIPLHAFAQL